VRLALGRQVWLALAVTVVAVALMFLASTWGLSAWNRAQSVPAGGSSALPVALESAPPSVATTDEYGPLGTVSMVWAGTEVQDGLFGELDRPWLALSARSGDYRALVAPELPPPVAGGVALTGAGDQLAWATGEGVEVYDPVTGEAGEVPLPGASAVGSFSPDGDLLLVHAEGLQVLDVVTGEVLAGVDGTEEAVVRRAAWRPDGSAVDLVEGDDLVALPVDGGEPERQPSPFSAAATLAWSPSGEQLVGMQQVDGITRLLTAPARADGRLGPARQVDTSGISLDRLLGFSGEETVAVSAYFLESGAIERVIDVSLDGGEPVDLTTLPSEGRNWVGSRTLAVSATALRSGATDFGSQLWPWSHTARLVTCTLIGLFGLGMWLTRRPRAARRRRRGH